MQEQDPSRKLKFRKPEGIRRVCRPAVRWPESVEEGLKIRGAVNWQREVPGSRPMRAIVEESKVHDGLQRQEDRKNKTKVLERPSHREHAAAANFFESLSNKIVKVAFTLTTPPPRSISQS